VKVSELIDQLRQQNPDAEVRIYHLSRVGKNGMGHVFSFPVASVNAAGEQVTLNDFTAVEGSLWNVKEAEWGGEPALGRVGPARGEGVETLLVDPPFTAEEWARLVPTDMRQGRALAYFCSYREAVARSGRTDELLAEAGFLQRGDSPLNDRVIGRVLRGLVTRHEFSLHRMEVLMAAGDFARFAQEHEGIRLGKKTVGWLSNVDVLAAAALFFYADKHYKDAGGQK
jgi:hypothetical protein